MKILSIIIPAYNSQDYLEKCVDSILALENEIQIIIVDDGSKDRTGEIADEYEKKYPTICKVVHQENGGHGGAINTGIQYAEGKYTVVIDSDDWVDKASGQRLLSEIKRFENIGKIDIVVCNYVYTYADNRKDSVIDYKNVFPTHEIFGWDRMKKFGLTQYLMIHSCIINTEFLRLNWTDLPRHVFYEDNLFVNSLVAIAKKMIYINENFYYYFIGRADQSMQEENVRRRYKDQIIVINKTFENKFIVQEVKKKSKVGKCLYHHIVMMLLFCAMNARINNSDNADKDIELMWNHIRKNAPAASKMIKRNFLVYITSVPGKFGRRLCILVYRIYKLSELVQVN